MKGLYYLRTGSEHYAHMDSELLSDLSLWHAQIAHVNVDGIKHMSQNGVISGLKVDVQPKPDVCDSCVVGKHTRTTSPKQGRERAKHPLEVVRSDVSGPMDRGSLRGWRYFVTLID